MRILTLVIMIVWLSMVAAGQSPASRVYKIQINKAQQVIQGNQTNIHQYDGASQDYILIEWLTTISDLMETKPASDPQRITLKLKKDSIERVLRSRMQARAIADDYLRGRPGLMKPVKTDNLMKSVDTKDVRQFLEANHNNITRERNKLLLQKQEAEASLQLIDDRLTKVNAQYLRLSNLAREHNLDSLDKIYLQHVLATEDDPECLQRLAEYYEHAPEIALQYYYLLLCMYGIPHNNVIDIAGTLLNLPDEVREKDSFLHRQHSPYNRKFDNTMNIDLYVEVKSKMQYLVGQIYYKRQQWDSAAICFLQASKTLEPVIESSGITTIRCAQMAVIYECLSFVANQTGDTEQEMNYLQTSVAYYDDLIYEDSILDASYLEPTAKASFKLALLFARHKQFEQAISYYDNAIFIYRALVTVDSSYFRPYLARTLSYIATARYDDTKSRINDTCLAEWKEAIRLYEQIHVDEPDSYLDKKANALNYLGLYYTSSREDSALIYFQQAFHTYQQQETIDSFSCIYQLTGVLGNWVSSISVLPVYGDSIPLLIQADLLYNKLARTNDWDHKANHVNTLNSLAVMAARQGEKELAEKIWKQADSINNTLSAEPSIEKHVTDNKKLIEKNRAIFAVYVGPDLEKQGEKKKWYMLYE